MEVFILYKYLILHCLNIFVVMIYLFNTLIYKFNIIIFMVVMD